MSRFDDDAEMYGYSSYTCRRHGRFWSDSGDGCPACEDFNDEAELQDLVDDTEDEA